MKFRSQNVLTKLGLSEALLQLANTFAMVRKSLLPGGASGGSGLPIAKLTACKAFLRCIRRPFQPEGSDKRALRVQSSRDRQSGVQASEQRRHEQEFAEVYIHR